MAALIDFHDPRLTLKKGFQSSFNQH